MERQMQTHEVRHLEIPKPPRVLNTYRARMEATVRRRVHRADADPFDGAGVRAAGHLSPADLPFPSRRLIGAPKVPAPPLVDLNAKPKQRVDTLVRAYRGAIERRWLDASIDYRAIWAFLQRSYEVLASREIPPSAWADWSCDAWDAMSVKAGEPQSAPTLFFVYAIKRIEKHQGWFEAAYAPLLGRVIYGPYAQSVIDRYTLLNPLMARGVSLDEAVALVFPEGYERACALGLRESELVQRELRERADAGEYLWHVGLRLRRGDDS